MIRGNQWRYTVDDEDKRSSQDRRISRDRRSGRDTRSEEEKCLMANDDPNLKGDPVRIENQMLYKTR
jgi:hypothetical protein